MPTYVKRTVYRKYIAAGAIDINATDVTLEASAGAAMTLADPPASPHWNGHTMVIKNLNAQTHTVTNTTGFDGAGASGDVLTLDAVGDAATIMAVDGKWRVVDLQGSAVA